VKVEINRVDYALVVFRLPVLSLFRKESENKWTWTGTHALTATVTVLSKSNIPLLSFLLPRAIWNEHGRIITPAYGSVRQWPFLRSDLYFLSHLGILLQFRILNIASSFYYLQPRPITMVAPSKAWTVFLRSNSGFVSSNPTQRMDVCVRLFCVCVALCCCVCR
jgi:hypothetical protein